MNFLNKFSPTIIILGLISITELISVGTLGSGWLWIGYGIFILIREGKISF